tara:strand:- start:3834 stop:5528 length:1695 start_codon:yes stop_codon:yes gene_type:complete
MPKQTYIINKFHGGINNSSDPRDIKDSELSDCTDLMVDELGIIRTIGSNATHDTPVLDNTGAGVTQTPGSGLFYFAHDRKGGEDAGDNEAETGDSYLALYDDSDAQIWIYSLAEDDWNDDKDSSENGVINFIGKTTGAAARPSYYSVDGNLRVSTGEFSHYDSNANTAEAVDTTETVIDKTNDTNIVAGNYIRIEDSLDEIMYVVSVDNSADTMTVKRGMFGTKQIEHATGKNIYILNMNQWYGYVNNKFFQDSTTTPVYTTDKWYNAIQHIRSLDELGITLITYDATSSSPTATQISAINKIVVAYWFTTTDEDAGFWQGSYWLGMTPVYLGDQEGPVSVVGSEPVQIHKEILNVQLYISHPDIDDASIVAGDGHPLIDDRIIGLKLYIKNYTSDEWFLLKEFDLLEGGEHKWATYNSDAGANTSSSGGNTLTGYWKTTSTADSLSVAAPSATESYDGEDESNTCVVTLHLDESKGTGRKGTLRLNGFSNSPLYEEVDLSSEDSQAKTFNVINPGVGTHKFVAELLDENFNIMKRAEIQQAISDSGVTTKPSTHGGGGGGGSS